MKKPKPLDLVRSGVMGASAAVDRNYRWYTALRDTPAWPSIFRPWPIVATLKNQLVEDLKDGT